MEIKKTKFVRKSVLNKSIRKKFKRSVIMNIKQETFKFFTKIGNTRCIIVSELCRLTKNERRKWFQEEMEKGNPVLKSIARIVNEIYNERIRRDGLNEGKQ